MEEDGWVDVSIIKMFAQENQVTYFTSLSSFDKIRPSFEENDCKPTSTLLVLKLLTVVIVTFTVGSIVLASTICVVALAPATHTVSSTLTLSAIILLTGCSQGVLVFVPNFAVTELTNVTFVAPK